MSANCRKMLAAFRRALIQRPLVTQMLTSGVISGTGDAIAQLAIEKRSLKNYDVVRTARFFVLTGFIISPCLHRWFIVLEKIKGGSPRILPLKRLAVDQIFFAPGFNAFILTWLRVLEGYSPQESLDQCKRDWWKIWTTSLTVWPAAQLFNFYLVPLPFRVIFVQCVALFWNSYLSFATQKKMVHPHEVDY